MSSSQEGKPIRFSRRQATLRQAAIDAAPDIQLPNISEWREVDALFDRAALTLEGKKRDESALLESPAFVLPRNTTIYFSLFVETNDPCGLRLSLRSTFETVAERAIFGSGEIALSFRHVSKRGGKFSLVLAGYQPNTAIRAKARLVRLTARAVPNPGTTYRTQEDQACLPHWTKWQRLIHDLCGRSRWVNAAVATWEMHLGHEEVLSLPQYMAICPTGQCNASCGFCSVTTNRSGIIKKQLPFEALDRFLSPVFGSLRLFGLEGNGEPTLYDRFDELLFRVTSRGASVYLISNGERLTDDQIALLLASPTNAINFSLNAATAETHRRVMRLKGWDAVIRNISRFVRWRGDADAPLLSVSLVVTRDNAHEVQQFLHLAEWQLKVDRILIRPLSEIANDTGVIEDLRELVPYESQINDMLDAVAEYLAFVPRRAEIVIDPAAFNAFRQEPRGVIVSPPGFEDQLLAPRSPDWLVESGETQIRWLLNRMELTSPAPENSILVRTRLIPVEAGRLMTFRCRVLARKGTPKIVISDESGNVIGSAIPDSEKSVGGDILTVQFMAPAAGAVSIELHADGRHIEWTVDFGHMYSSPALADRQAMLPHSSRWQLDMPGTSARWNGSELTLDAQAQPGLYLYRSYKVPCLPGESISLPVQVNIERGALGIGILSEDANEWLATERFESEERTSEIAFNTGRHNSFQVVLYSLTEEPLRTRVDWKNNLGALPLHKNRQIEPRELVLPTPASWIVNTSGSDIQWQDSSVQIISNGPKDLYLLRSPRFPCPRLHSAMPRLSLRVTVKQGRLGIGFLGNRTEQFTSLSCFPVGEHNATIDIDTGGQQSLMITLFSDSPEPLEASVDWGESLRLDPNEAPSEWREGLFDPRNPELASPSRTASNSTPQEEKLDNLKRASPSSIRTRLANVYMRAGLAGVIRKGTACAVRRSIGIFSLLYFWVKLGILGLLYLWMKRNKSSLSFPTEVWRGEFFNALLKIRFPNARIYCQKPWTDLNNFTVDGRMDVCCITTGPSQERYALGNIYQQDFQEIWNSERMKEFRRTVNAKDKLPPCIRCPMANNYRPPF